MPHSSWVFSSKSTWDAVRIHGSPVSWAPVVWYGGYVPRYAFLLWLVLRGRIKTQDRLRMPGLYIVSRCALCCCAYEVLHHLFLGCSFSRAVVSLAAATLQLDFNGTIQVLPERFFGLSTPLRQQALFSLEAFVYFIWQKRVFLCCSQIEISGSNLGLYLRNFTDEIL